MLKLLLWSGTLSSLIAVHSASAETPSALAGQLYLGLSLTGTVGTIYAIQATTELGEAERWTCRAFLQLPAPHYTWTDTSAPSTGQRFYRAVTTAPTNLVFIPPGTFRMGSPTNETGDPFGIEMPQTAVTLTKGFYIGKFPVTQGEYLAVTGSNPSYFNTNHGFSLELTRPVEMVSSDDATNYCAKRTQQEAVAGRIPAGARYRLPTEAEWEYACRAWTSTRFYYGEDPGYTNLTNYAWYGAKSAGTTQPVGQKLPNLWGLYDMAGNIWEWCQWVGPYPGGSVIDPQGLDSNPVSLHVLRGGDWETNPEGCRSAARFLSSGDYRVNFFGFRVVLVPDS